MFCLKQIETIEESKIYSPEIAIAGSQTLNCCLVFIETVMTIMEADESDEYLKIVCAPQLLKFFNISNQIRSMYQLIQLQYRSTLTWTTFVKIWLP